VKQRASKCAQALKKGGYAALLISDPLNVAYLTGFGSGEGYLLLTSDSTLVYFTSFLYKEAAGRAYNWKLCVSNHRNIFTLIAQEIKKRKLHRVAFEAKHLPFLEYKTIRRECPSGTELIPLADFVARLRMIKSAQEIGYIKKSTAISREAFDFIGEVFSDTMSEKDLSIEIERFLRLKGDNQIAFSPIIAAGRNSSCPHHVPGEEVIGRRCFLIDLGSKYCGYCADLTRIFFNGKISPLFKRAYDVIRKARDVSIAKVRDGIAACDVDRAARDCIEKQGWGRLFGHGLGHGVGLAVHEPPFLNPHNKETLQEGMVITIEPAVYFPHRFGMRLEDMVLVRRQKGEVLCGSADR
jgi:Xaa-Pro aminopeptidase